MIDNSYDYKGYDIEVKVDEEPMDPREDDDYLMGRMACFHGRYKLGDKHNFDCDMFKGWAEMAEHIRVKLKASIILPLFLYDHSGLRIKIGSFNGYVAQGHAEFDSGQVGFIYTTNDIIKKNYAIKKVTKAKLKLAAKRLYNEVEAYDAFISGQVYEYVISKDSDTQDYGDGYYDYKQAQESAERCVNALLKRKGNK